MFPLPPPLGGTARRGWLPRGPWGCPFTEPQRSEFCPGGLQARPAPTPPQARRRASLAGSRGLAVAPAASVPGGSPRAQQHLPAGPAARRGAGLGCAARGAGRCPARSSAGGPCAAARRSPACCGWGCWGRGRRGAAPRRAAPRRGGAARAGTPPAWPRAGGWTAPTAPASATKPAGAPGTAATTTPGRAQVGAGRPRVFPPGPWGQRRCLAAPRRQPRARRPAAPRGALSASARCAGTAGAAHTVRRVRPRVQAGSQRVSNTSGLLGLAHGNGARGKKECEQGAGIFRVGPRVRQRLRTAARRHHFRGFCFREMTSWRQACLP